MTALVLVTIVLLLAEAATPLSKAENVLTVRDNAQSESLVEVRSNEFQSDSVASNCFFDLALQLLNVLGLPDFSQLLRSWLCPGQLPIDTCPNIATWNPPKMYVLYNQKTINIIKTVNKSDVVMKDTNITGTYTLETFRTNKAGTLLHVIDGTNISTYSRAPCSDEFRKLGSVYTGVDIQYLTLDPTERYLVTSDSIGGSTMAYKLNADGTLSQTGVVEPPGGTGKLGSEFEPARALFHPTQQDMVGVTFKKYEGIAFYRLDSATGSLTTTGLQAKVSQGDNTNDLVFSSSGRYMYSISYTSSMITVFEVLFGIDGKISGFNATQQIPSVVSPGSSIGSSGSGIALHPNGNYLYAMPYEEESIGVFQVDSGSGTLTLLKFQEVGEGVFQFIISPKGDQLLVDLYRQGTITYFNIGDDGMLTPSGNLADPSVSPAYIVYPPKMIM